jgi:hypothetical protein
MLHQLEQMGVLSNDLALTVLLRKGVRDASSDRLARVAEMEKAVLALLPELAPDADMASGRTAICGGCARISSCAAASISSPSS